jgi:light-regulated signal transduction histidine kinase (bacteriophytochrome)
MHPLDFVADEDKPKAVEALQNVFENGHATLDVDLIAKGGRRLPHLLTGRRVILDGKECVVGLGIDVSDRRRIEEEVRRLNEELEHRVAQRTAQLEAVNRELEAFSYSVSHDLRAPLRHIDGFAKLLVKRVGDQLDEKARRYVRTISESAERMGRLIDNLLDLSRTGRAELHMQRVDLNELVREVQHELTPLAEGRTIAWVVPELPAVEGDATLLRLAWTNLLANAIKFTGPQANPRIEIAASVNGAGEVTFGVRDNGVGFDPKYAHKLFGVFQRLHREEDFGGTGVGLATVRRVIERHGGRVWAEGAPGQGATFYFTLKLANGGAEHGGQTDSAGRG